MPAKARFSINQQRTVEVAQRAKPVDRAAIAKRLFTPLRADPASKSDHGFQPLGPPEGPKKRRVSLRPMGALPGSSDCSGVKIKIPF